MKKMTQTSFRIDEETMQELNDSAKRLGIPVSSALRIFVRNGLSQYDGRHEELLAKFDQFEASFSSVNVMLSAVVLAAARIDIAKDGLDKVMDWKVVSEHVKYLLTKGKPVSEAVIAGRFG
jgi:hypothetical protein